MTWICQISYRLHSELKSFWFPVKFFINICFITAWFTIVCVTCINWSNMYSYWNVSLLLLFSLLLLGLISFFLITVQDAINAVALIILMFLISSVLLISTGVQFVGLNLIIIYLGAILVLLVFVIMLSNTKTLRNFYLHYFYKLLFLIICVKQIFLFHWVFKCFIFSTNKNTSVVYIANGNKLPELAILSPWLYNYQKFNLLLATLILLLALVVSILLTTRFYTEKHKNFFFKNLKKKRFLYWKYFHPKYFLTTSHKTTKELLIFSEIMSIIIHLIMIFRYNYYGEVQLFYIPFLDITFLKKPFLLINCFSLSWLFPLMFFPKKGKNYLFNKQWLLLPLRFFICWEWILLGVNLMCLYQCIFG